MHQLNNNVSKPWLVTYLAILVLALLFFLAVEPENHRLFMSGQFILWFLGGLLAMRLAKPVTRAQYTLTVVSFLVLVVILCWYALAAPPQIVETIALIILFSNIVLQGLLRNQGSR